MVIKEGSFDFIVSATGRITLVLLARDDPPASPFIVYDRGKLLAFFRSKLEIVELEKVPRKVIKLFLYASSIDITEMLENGEIVRQYTAKVILDGMLKHKLKKERRSRLGG